MLKGAFEVLNRILGQLDPDLYEWYQNHHQTRTGLRNRAVNTTKNNDQNVISSSTAEQQSLSIDKFDIHFPEKIIVPTPKAAHQNGEILSPKGLSACLSYLTASDLKNCRLVSRFWHKSSALPFKNSTCFVIKWDEALAVSGAGTKTGRGSKKTPPPAPPPKPYTLFSEGPAQKCIKYLATSTTKFTPWKTLRLKKLKESQIVILLGSPEFQHSAKMIVELEVIFCEMTWTSLLRIMKYFINLSCFLDNRNNYKGDDAHQNDDAVNGLVSINSSSSLNRIDSTFIRGGVSIETLKCLKICKANCNWNTIDLLKIMTVTTVDLEEFHIKSDPKNENCTMLQMSEFQSHLNILFILNSSTLRIIYMDMLETENTDVFNEFLTCFQDWTTTNPTANFPLRRLTLKFKYIWLGKSFDNVFIKLVKKLKRLEILGLGIIAFKADSFHLLDKLKNSIPPNCIFEFGLYLTDHERKLSESEEEKEEEKRGMKNLKNSKHILKSQLYKEHMSDLLIGIFHDGIQCIGDLIPDLALESAEKKEKEEQPQPQQQRSLPSKNSRVRIIKHGNKSPFVVLTDLAIFTNGWRKRNFQSFDIPLICRNFGGLTKLEIVDGPWENYLEDEKFRKISEARVIDRDLQNILQYLVGLETLMIFANQVSLSDVGMTGLDPEAVQRMNATHQYRTLDSKEVLGYSFSNLKYLSYLSLRGVGDKLTDVTIYHAFNNLKYLKTLIIFRFPRLTPEGRDTINHMFPERKGCFVGIA